MMLTFRWFGPDDQVTLERVRQIPGVDGIVSALYDLPAGDVWPKESLERLAARIDTAGFRFAVVESVPIHEDIKLGLPSRERQIEHYCRTIEHIGAIGIPVLCYNFMPVFDWMRTDFDFVLPDGSRTLAYDHAILERMDLSRGMARLPAWADGYDGERLRKILAAYRSVAAEQLWEHLAYFLERVVPVAASTNVKLALHPDDPPWSIFGLPRIITDGAALTRVVGLVDKPANGITFCTGSLGALPTNDLPALVRQIGSRIHFAHCRNVQVTGERRFHEVPHPSRYGRVDMLRVLQALHDVGFDGPMRSDHGRMIWDETGRAAYGLYDRALGTVYLEGLWEAVSSNPGGDASGRVQR